MQKSVLVTSELISDAELARISKAATVYASWKMGQDAIEKALPEVDALIVFFWPSFLNDDALRKMKRLRFLQSILVGVNHVPFGSLSGKVVVSSNAGAYSLEVAEHAWALLLAAEKKVVDHHVRIRNGVKSLSEFSHEADRIKVLEGKTLGIVGYGSIGRAVQKYASAFGMNVVAFGRGTGRARGARLYKGKEGLDEVLRKSDVVLLSIPLSRFTSGLIGGRELSLMKEDATLVNIARGDLVDQKALYAHLTSHPNFKYAADAWWFREGRESLETDFPFATLRNFVGTPHMSGPTGVASGRPARLAVDNVLRYLGGKTPLHIVDRKEYEAP